MERAADIAEILKLALALPPEARAALADSLLGSIEDVDPGDVSIEEAWKQEIDRRIAELESGTVKPVPWEEVRRQMMARLRAH